MTSINLPFPVLNVAQREDYTPPGWLPGSFSSVAEHSANDATDSKGNSGAPSKRELLLYNSALSVATAPGKQLFATALMLWMSGNSLQIFSIFMLGMAFMQPLQRLMSIQQEFQRFAGVNLILPKLIFTACNLAGILLALYKCNSMGLLPTAATDWLPSGVEPVDVYAFGVVNH